MQCGLASEKFRRAVDGTVVQERPPPAQLILEVGELAAAARVLVTLVSDREGEAIARRRDNAGRPNFYVEFDPCAQFQALSLGVRMIWPPGLRERWIEFAVRRPQPALPHRRVRVNRALEDYLLHFERKHAQHGKDIGTLGARRNKQFHSGGAGDFGFGGMRRLDKRQPRG